MIYKHSRIQKLSWIQQLGFSKIFVGFSKPFVRFSNFFVGFSNSFVGFSNSFVGFSNFFVCLGLVHLAARCQPKARYIYIYIFFLLGGLCLFWNWTNCIRRFLMAIFYLHLPLLHSCPYRCQISFHRRLLSYINVFWIRSFAWWTQQPTWFSKSCWSVGSTTGRHYVVDGACSQTCGTDTFVRALLLLPRWPLLCILYCPGPDLRAFWRFY